MGGVDNGDQRASPREMTMNLYHALGPVYVHDTVARKRPLCSISHGELPIRSGWSAESGFKHPTEAVFRVITCAL